MPNDNKSAPRFFPPGNNHPAPPSATNELKVFIPAKLDDYGLTPNVFRVYCHMARRAGKDAAWPAIKKIARVCRLHPQTVRKTLRFLVGHHFLLREDRRGLTTRYRLTPLSAWLPSPRIDSKSK